MGDETLLVVDGANVAYRSHFAIADLTTKSGRPTNAVFGFIKILQQLQQVWKPTHCVVVFDGGLPDERMSRLPTYKAQRTPMPDQLREQFPLIEEYLQCAAIPSVRIEKQEADDVMATLAEKSRPRRVLMATSDKDLFQLVDERVAIIPPAKAVTKMGPAEVCEKTGVEPGLIVQWLALTGDDVDNIPGVPGVGPKTATKLLKEFGSLDNLWSALDRVASERIRSALAAHRPDVLRNVELITLRRDLPVEPDWASMAIRPPNPDRLVPFYERMEFESLARPLRILQAEGPELNFGAP